MKIDIILITYNQEQYVAQAVESILMQRVNDDVQVRVIVADDCSQDKTLEIIKSYEEKSPFPFMYLPGESNMGHVRNYQRAFAQCTGDYALVLEGDDYWCSPKHAQDHIDFLDLHKECCLSVNGIILLWENERMFEFNPRTKDEVIYINLRQQIIKNHIGNHSSACYRTAILKTLPDIIFSSSFDDALLGIYFAQFGFIAMLKEYTTVYRKHRLGLWSGKEDKYHVQEIIRRLKVNDEIFNYKYHTFFEEALEKYKDNNKHNYTFRDFVPPIIVIILKILFPKVLINKCKKILR